MKILPSILNAVSKLLDRKSSGNGTAHSGPELKAAMDDSLRMQELLQHFAGADGLSARAAANSRVRKNVREKVRFERSQNSYLSGMLLTASNYLIGTGPKLQMTMLGPNGRIDRASNRKIEQDWARWSRRIRFGEKLRTLVVAKKGDGEGFGVMTYNPAVGDDTGIPLDMTLVECDQMEDLTLASMVDPYGAGGIVFDEYDNPVKYPLMDYHPGDDFWWQNISIEPKWLNRDFVVHLFRKDRPGQRRGVSEWLPAMPLFALYRRMTLATVGNIETSASLSAVMESDAEYDENGKSITPWGTDDWFQSFPIVRRMIMSLPAGAKLNQFKSSQPNSEYDAFCRSLLREIARCTGMPYNIAAGDSSSYNYSSGRLDHQSFFLSNRVEVTDIEAECVERVFDRWLRIRASRESGIAPTDIDTSLYSHQWVWDGLEHVDPLKEANASAVKLANGITTRGREYFRQGVDIDDVDERAAEELGFNSVQEYRQAIAAHIFGKVADQANSVQRPDSVPTRRDVMSMVEEAIEELSLSK